MKDMVSAVLFGAAIGAAATMFYMNNEEEINSVGRQLKDRSGDTLGMLCSLGRSALRKQV